MYQLADMELRGKRVLIRQDLNVPIRNGVVASDKRIMASLGTIQDAVAAGAKVMVMSHLGRPEEGVFDSAFSLEPVADCVSQRLGVKVKLNSDYLFTPPELKNGEVVLLENVRFNLGEKSNDEELSRAYASLCDVFVMDAFGTAHRAQASTQGVAQFAPIACSGPLLQNEIEALSGALDQPDRPMVAIVGGAKVSSKLTVLESLSNVVDQLVPGGGIANTFIAAAGHNVGASLFEQDLIHEAKKLMMQAEAKGREIPIPVDVVVGKSFSRDAEPVIKSVQDIDDMDMILDIGPETSALYAQFMQNAGTIVWNGPVGVFEFDQFSRGTQQLGKAIAESSAFSIAGGGDTLAAVDKYNLGNDISYISTGGGAFLEFLEGKTLPAIKILSSRFESSEA
ncbi:MAG: phosphoglycerate kinase [Gammaproteobacteria bacterium]|nr:phosphoglycerate kinase [Gammaproteobacteria bacterium]